MTETELKLRKDILRLQGYVLKLEDRIEKLESMSGIPVLKKEPLTWQP